MAISITNKINNTVLDFVRGVPFQSLNKFEVNLSVQSDDNAGLDALDSVGAAAGASSLANIVKALTDFTNEEDPSLNKIIRVGSSVLMQLYAQSITVSFPEIETNHLVNGVKYIKDIKIPEDIEITFLEDEFGLTLRLIEYWKTKIIGYDNYIMYSDKATDLNFTGRKVRSGGKTYDSSGTTYKSDGTQEENQLSTEDKNKLKSKKLRNYSGSTLNFFNDNNLESSNDPNATFGYVAKNKSNGIEYYKVNMFIKPLGVQDESIVFPGIRIKGAFPKSIDSMTFSHDSQDFMTHKVRFSVDTIYVSKYV